MCQTNWDKLKILCQCCQRYFPVSEVRVWIHKWHKMYRADNIEQSTWKAWSRPSREKHLRQECFLIELIIENKVCDLCRFLTYYLNFLVGLLQDLDVLDTKIGILFRIVFRFSRKRTISVTDLPNSVLYTSFHPFLCL